MLKEQELQDKTIFIPAKVDPSEEQVFLLPDTGFNINLQMNMLPKTPTTEEFDSWLKKTREDIKAFWLEYLVRLPLLPIQVDIGNKDDDARLVAPDYGNVNLVDTISESERNGSVKRSIGKIEEFLTNAGPNSIAILTSPPGWSGLVDEKNDPISYPDSQTYIFYKNSQEKIKGVTLVSHMDLSGNEDMLYSFSGQKVNENLTTKERTAIVTDTPILLESNGQYAFNLEGIVRAIHAINPDSFDLKRVLSLSDNLDNLQQITTWSYVDSLIKNFESSSSKIFNEDNLPENTAKMLGLTILEISRATRILHQEDTTDVSSYAPVYYGSESQHSPHINYREELRHLQSLGGCNGGGRKIGNGFIETSLGLRNITIGENTLHCTCPFCNKEVNATIQAGRIYCPSCGESAEYHC